MCESTWSEVARGLVVDVRRKVWLQEMTWEEVERRLRETEVALVPVGSTEQHGPALPLGTDTYVAIGLAEEAARRTGAVVAPPIWFGESSHHMAFPGTVTLRPETLIELVKDVCVSLAYHGFKKIIIINGHRRANLPPLLIAAKAVREETGAYVAVIDPSKISIDTALRLRETGGFHADEIETSHMLYLRPELVQLERAVAEMPKFPKYVIPDPYVGGDRVDVAFTAEDEAKLTTSGVMGDPTKATREKGEKYHQALVEVIVDFIRSIAEQE